MALDIIRANIFDLKADVMVNPTDYKLSGSGSIDKNVRELGGSGLEQACKNAVKCDFGNVVVTEAYDIKNYRYIFHTVGPFYDENKKQDHILINCYRECLLKAVEMNLKTINIPLIATGSFGYPIKKAIQIAINTINIFLMDYDLDVNLILYRKISYDICSKIMHNIKSYIENENEVNDSEFSSREEAVVFYSENHIPLDSNEIDGFEDFDNFELEDELKIVDEYDSEIEDEQVVRNSCQTLISSKYIYEKQMSSQDYVLNKINKYGFKIPEVYANAYISRQSFNNFLSGNQSLSRLNALKLCFTLPLTLSEALELLEKFGYTFDSSSREERALKYYLSTRTGNEIELSDCFDFDTFLYEQKITTHFFGA